jgi:hypothetical protein
LDKFDFFGMNDDRKERLAGLSSEDALDFEVLGRSEIAVSGRRSERLKKRLFWDPVFALDAVALEAGTDGDPDGFKEVF